jgi:hypothetical protein
VTSPDWEQENSMKPRCRAGDLAVVVNAYYRSNLGRIVKVLAPHDAQGALVFRDVGHVWLVEAPQPMIWTIGSRRFRRKCGPVPDANLKPIRGKPLAKRRKSEKVARLVHAELGVQMVPA